MDTKFLESLIAVAELGSITAAARQQNLTPGAVAQRVVSLESEIGARLLDRSGRGMSLTAIGSQVILRARAIVHDARSLRTLITEQSISGTIRIGAISTAIAGFLPEVLQSVSKSFPGVEVYIVPGVSNALYRQVIDRELDAAIFVVPDFKLPKTCNAVVFREEPLIVLASNALKASGAHELLRKYPLIRYDRTSWGGRLADAYLKRNRIDPIERYEIDSLEAIAVLVDRGLGVSLLPDWARPWPEGLHVRKWQLPRSDLRRRIGLFWNQASPWGTVIDLMAHTLKRG
jgi:DNA-binding transcriptional LysR family regulator